MKLREGDIIRGVAVSPKIQRIRFAELLEDFLTDYRINNKKSLSIVELRLKKHVKPFFGHRRASEISSATVSKYIQKRQEDEAANATINRELEIIRRTFILACKHGKLLNRPMFSLLSENNVRKGFFEPEQFISVLKFLPVYLHSLMRFLYITGWRRGEALTLKWKDVDFETRMVRLEVGSTKNREGRIFPFTAELKRLLEDQREETNRTQKRTGKIISCVFHTSDGESITDYGRAWKTACSAAKLEGRIVHDFRRTAIRNFARKGVPEQIGMKLAGHKTPSVYRRYNIIETADLVKAVKLLDGSGRNEETSKTVTNSATIERNPKLA